MTIQLALLGMAATGTADYVGGRAMRRDGRRAVVLVNAALASGIATVLVGLYVLVDRPERVTAADLAWATAAGALLGVARPLIMLGMGTGPVAVFAPVLALVSLLVPATVGPLLGERLAATDVAGVVLALPAAALVSSTGRVPSAAELLGSPVVRLGVVVGALAGSASVCLGRIDTAAEAAPALVLQAVALVVGVTIVVVSRRAVRPRNGAGFHAAGVGLLSAVAFVALTRAFQVGPVAVVAVVLGFAPAITIVLARALDRVVVRRLQLWGMALAAVATVLLALP